MNYRIGDKLVSKKEFDAHNKKAAQGREAKLEAARTLKVAKPEPKAEPKKEASK